MQRRIYGLETEYGVTCTFRGQRRLSPDEIARYLFRKVVSWGRSSNVFLQNGARLYLDVGSHPEYATAECDSVRELVAQDKAGERIVQGLVAAAEERLEEEGIQGEIYLFKNNTDSAGNSYGCHENYLAGRDDELAAYTATLVPFLITRQIFTGAGKIVTNKHGARFTLSQRAEHLWEGVSSATTRSRPIVNTRDEPHADAERFRRLHVICGDANLNEYATFLKVATTGLLLRTLEEAPELLRDFTLANAIRAVRDISDDLTFAATVTCENGEEVRAIEVQREYFGAVTQFAENHDLNSEEQEALSGWGDMLDAIESDFTILADRVDWVAKWQLFERLRERDGLDWEAPQLALLDLTYHDINPDRGVFARMERRGLARRITTDAQVETARHEPPQTTRAKLRGAFITAAKAAKCDYTVDWVHLKVNDTTQRTVLCKDPFRNEDPRVTKLIESL